MEKTVTATEARVHFGELLREVSENAGTFIVERGGRPAAAVVPLHLYRSLRGESWQASLIAAQKLRREIEQRRDHQPLPTPEDMLHEARELQDARFPDLR